MTEKNGVSIPCSSGLAAKSTTTNQAKDANQSKRLGFMRDQCIVGKDVDIKEIGREKIIAMFEGEEE